MPSAGRILHAAGLPDPGAAPSATSGTAAAGRELKAAWDGYYRALDEARVALERTSNFDDPQNRAKAYHILMELQAMAYNFVIAPRMTHPRLYSSTGWQTDLYTLGQNGPDFLYGVMFLDGRQTYRIHGRIGDIKLFVIQVQNNIPGEPGNKTIGNYDLADMDVGRDGAFEITMGGPKLARNWIPLDAAQGYHFVLVRRALLDWGNADVGEFHIDRISAIEPGHYDADEFDEAAMAARIRRAEQFIRYLTSDFTIKLYYTYLNAAHGQKNVMASLPGMTTSSVGNSFSSYAMGIFSLKDDEALIVKLDKAPTGVYWSYQLGSVWSRSLPFTDRQSTLNKAQVKADADGGIRVVISRKDPGVANWLDTTGVHEGTIVFRNYHAKAAVVPTTQKVKFDQIRANLPASTATVTLQQREQALEHRRAAVLKLYGE